MIGVDVDTGFVTFADAGNGVVVPSDRGVVAPGVAAPLVSGVLAPAPSSVVGGSEVVVALATVGPGAVAVAEVVVAAAADGTLATEPVGAFLAGRIAAAGNSEIAELVVVPASTAVAV